MSVLFYHAHYYSRSWFTLHMLVYIIVLLVESIFRVADILYRASLSLNKFPGPLMKTPNHLVLIPRADTKYLTIRNATRSGLKVLDSIVFFCLQKTWIRELLVKIIIPVWDICVILLPAWLT